MRSLTLLAATTVATSTVALASVSHATAGPPPFLAGDSGEVTLREMAGGGVTLPAGRSASRKTFSFRLPPGASQGPEVWYLIHLDVRVEFASGADQGSLFLAGLTNEMAAAQVQFYPERDRRRGQRVRRDSVDLIRGQVEGASAGTHGEARYRNYLQIKGVKPGLNTFTVEAERLGGVRVKQIEIKPTSGVYATPAGPVDLEVSVYPAEEEVAVGEAADLAVLVASNTPRKTEWVDVSVQPESNHLFTDGPIAKRIRDVRKGGVARFAIGRTRPGPMRLTVSAVAANGSEASTEVTVTVGNDGGSAWSKWIPPIGLLALLAAAGWLLRGRIRDRGRV